MGARQRSLTGISAFMYIMATLRVAVRWYYARRAFITHGETKETRFSALIDALIAGGPLWVPTISNVVTSINILTADCVIVRISLDSQGWDLLMFVLDLEVLDYLGKELEDSRPPFHMHALRNE